MLLLSENLPTHRWTLESSSFGTSQMFWFCLNHVNSCRTPSVACTRLNRASYVVSLSRVFITLSYPKTQAPVVCALVVGATEGPMDRVVSPLVPDNCNSHSQP